MPREGLAGAKESLRQEVEPLGIRVLVVEPGAFRTKAGSASYISGSGPCRRTTRRRSVPSELKFMVGHRGRVKLQVDIVGRNAHAARSVDGVDAVEALAVKRRINFRQHQIVLTVPGSAGIV
jgi:NAD(P)-dependent dehydrogenase (short-subunit alcohol dehydrogenase family)